MENDNVLMLSLEEALHPDVERMYAYDKILIPSSFEAKASSTIKLLYKPFTNVYVYETFVNLL